MRRPGPRPVLTALAATVLLAACSTGPAGGSGVAAEEGDAATSTAAADAFPVTIEHAFGETTIEQEPQRVATVGWSDQDIVVALGEVPAGATKITWGGNEAGSTEWWDAAVEALGADPAEVVRYDDTDGIPVDEIAQVAPDLILGTNSGMTQEDYDALSKIAPVVAYPEVAWGTPWRESVELVGRALGKSEEADAVIADLEEQIAAAVAEHPELEGTSFAWTWFTPSDLSTIGVYTTIDLRPQLMREFGMEDASKVVELSEGGEAFSVNLSAEQADTLDADVMFFWATDEAEAEAVTSHPLVSQVPAVENGSYVAVTDMPLMAALSSPTPLTIPVVLEEFLPLAAEAAASAR
jgi:iron complex transport system substrate-binding protein